MNDLSVFRAACPLSAYSPQMSGFMGNGRRTSNDLPDLPIRLGRNAATGR